MKGVIWEIQIGRPQQSLFLLKKENRSNSAEEDTQAMVISVEKVLIAVTTPIETVLCFHLGL